MTFHLEQRIVLAKLVASSKTQSEGKPDMIEANTTYLWQTQNGIDVRGLCASVPASSTKNIHADMGITMPVSAFFISGNTSLPQISA